MSFSKQAIDTYKWNDDAQVEQDYLTCAIYAFYYQGKQIGKCGTEIQTHINGWRGVKQFYPDNWFEDDCGEKLKPVLDVNLYSTKGNQHQGFGRAGLQALYAFSVQNGCGGRMHLTATDGAGGFYEHCGFIGLSPKSDGLKYFDPTPENIQLLFAKKQYDLTLVKTSLPPVPIVERLAQITAYLKQNGR